MKNHFPSAARIFCHGTFRARALAFAMLTATLAVNCAVAQSAPKQDLLIFTNGDQLTGKLVSESAGSVVFKSDMTGTSVTVPWSKIKELHSSQSFAVIKNNQELRPGRPANVPIGTVGVTNDEISITGPTGEVRQIPAKDVAYLVNGSDFKRTSSHEPSFFHAWQGTATLGVSLVEATQTSKTFTGVLALVRPIPSVAWLTPRNKTLFDATVLYGSVKQPAVGTTPASSAKTDILHGDVERDWYLTPRFFALADASADHNFGSGLQLQYMFGGGAGYSVLRQPIQTLDVKTDIHYERQEFYPAAAGVAGVSLNLVGIDVGELYMRKLVHGMVLNESGLIQPAFNHPSAYTAQFIAGLNFPAYRNFGFSLGAQDNYLNNPPAGFKKNTFLLTAGLNYSFK